MRVLVTGGAGFIGSHLVDALVCKGDEVVVLDNFHRGRRDNIQAHLDCSHVRLIDGDIRNPASVDAAMDGVDLVYHLAAQPNVLGSVSEATYSVETNVLGTHHVLEAAARAGVSHVVFSSSREVYGEPATLPVPESAPLLAKNPYGASKIAGEAYCRAWHGMGGPGCTILRFGNVYGPRDFGRVIPLWLDYARNGEAFPVFGGQQLLDFVDVELAVKALLAVATVDVDGPINVATGSGTTLHQLALRLLHLTGGRSSVDLKPARSVEVVKFVADVGRMRDILGLEPPADPLAGLAKMTTS